jgi:hypothetical protein
MDFPLYFSLLRNSQKLRNSCFQPKYPILFFLGTAFNVFFSIPSMFHTFTKKENFFQTFSCLYSTVLGHWIQLASYLVCSNYFLLTMPNVCKAYSRQQFLRLVILILILTFPFYYSWHYLTRLLNIFSPKAITCPYWIRGPPSWLWPKRNQLLRLGHP